MGIIGRDPSVQFQPVTCRHLSDLLDLFEVYSIDSSKMSGNIPEVLNFNRVFLNLNRFICN